MPFLSCPIDGRLAKTPSVSNSREPQCGTFTFPAFGRRTLGKRATILLRDNPQETQEFSPALRDTEHTRKSASHLCNAAEPGPCGPRDKPSGCHRTTTRKATLLTGCLGDNGEPLPTFMATAGKYKKVYLSALAKRLERESKHVRSVGRAIAWNAA